MPMIGSALNIWVTKAGVRPSSIMDMARSQSVSYAFDKAGRRL